MSFGWVQIFKMPNQYMTLRRAAWIGLALSLSLMTASASVHAESVSHEFRGLELVGNIELAGGKTLAKDGAALIVHGTSGHHRMEIIEGLQRNLKARGINSLAITFSMGLDRRQGAYPCTIEHDHRHMDGVEEITSWIAWLKISGAKRISLIGHSRGGNQVALYMSLNRIMAAGGLTAPVSENIESFAMPSQGEGAAANAGSVAGVVKIRYGGTFDKPDPMVKNMVLIAPMTWTYEKARRSYPKKFKKLLGPVLKQARKRKADDEGMMLMQGIGFLNCPKARVTADAFIDYYAANPYYFTPTLLPYIKTPVLVVAGDNDDIVPELPGAMSSLPYAKNVRLEMVSGADHFFRDFLAEELADKIAAFLKNARKPKS